MPATTYRLALPSVPASTAQAVHFAEAIARDEGLPQELADRLVLVAGEAVANAVIHGNGLDPGRTVYLTWTEEPEGGWLSIEDEGTGFDLDRLRQAHLPDDPMQAGGRGLYIMKALCDAFEVSGSCLRLRFAPRSDETYPEDRLEA